MHNDESNLNGTNIYDRFDKRWNLTFAKPLTREQKKTKNMCKDG